MYLYTSIAGGGAGGGGGLMNPKPCVQLTSTLNTDCLVTEHMISALTERCVMKLTAGPGRCGKLWTALPLPVPPTPDALFVKHHLFTFYLSLYFVSSDDQWK